MAAENKTDDERSTEDKALNLETAGNILKIADIEKAQKAGRTPGEKVSQIIAVFCGSMPFVYVHIVWFVAWIVINSVFTQFQFDPFPYTFLTFVVSLEAIFLSTFILISQNHETQITERRNHLDLQINLLVEQENTKMIELLHLIAVKVGVPEHNVDTAALLEPMEPGKLVDQITASIEDTPKEAAR